MTHQELTPALDLKKHIQTALNAYIQQIECGENLARLLQEPEEVAKYRLFLGEAKNLRKIIMLGKGGSNGWHEASRSVIGLLEIVNYGTNLLAQRLLIEEPLPEQNDGSVPGYPSQIYPG
jgi:hypothetical protein